MFKRLRIAFYKWKNRKLQVGDLVRVKAKVDPNKRYGGIVGVCSAIRMDKYRQAHVGKVVRIKVIENFGNRIFVSKRYGLEGIRNPFDRRYVGYTEEMLEKIYTNEQKKTR